MLVTPAPVVCELKNNVVPGFVKLTVVPEVSIILALSMSNACTLIEPSVCVLTIALGAPIVVNVPPLLTINF